MMDHPERLTDFADRAIHETAAKGKAIVAAFYGNGPRLSYFNGCSTGGRQALTAAQRFPDDFDGIVAGAPAIYASQQSAGQIWIWNATHKDDASFLTPAKYAVLHDAVVAQCDLLDGVKDGVLEDPTRCTFDPKVVQCKDADDPTVSPRRRWRPRARSTPARRTAQGRADFLAAVSRQRAGLGRVGRRAAGRIRRSTSIGTS